MTLIRFRFGKPPCYRVTGRQGNELVLERVGDLPPGSLAWKRRDTLNFLDFRRYWEVVS